MYQPTTLPTSVPKESDAYAHTYITRKQNLAGLRIQTPDYKLLTTKGKWCGWQDSNLHGLTPTAT